MNSPTAKKTNASKRNVNEKDIWICIEMWRKKRYSKVNERRGELVESMSGSLEEASKRLCVDKNTYQQVGFSYDEPNASKEPVKKATEGKTRSMLGDFFTFSVLEVSQPLDDDEYEPFYPSEKLQLPYGMEIVSDFSLESDFKAGSFTLARVHQAERGDRKDGELRLHIRSADGNRRESETSEQPSVRFPQIRSLPQSLLSSFDHHDQIG